MGFLKSLASGFSQGFTRGFSELPNLMEQKRREEERYDAARFAMRETEKQRLAEEGAQAGQFDVYEDVYGEELTKKRKSSAFNSLIKEGQKFSNLVESETPYLTINGNKVPDRNANVDIKSIRSFVNDGKNLRQRLERVIESEAAKGPDADTELLNRLEEQKNNVDLSIKETQNYVVNYSKLTTNARNAEIVLGQNPTSVSGWNQKREQLLSLTANGILNSDLAESLSYSDARGVIFSQSTARQQQAILGKLDLPKDIKDSLKNEIQERQQLVKQGKLEKFAATLSDTDNPAEVRQAIGLLDQIVTDENTEEVDLFKQNLIRDNNFSYRQQFNLFQKEVMKVARGLADDQNLIVRQGVSKDLSAQQREKRYASIGGLLGRAEQNAQDRQGREQTDISDAYVEDIQNLSVSPIDMVPDAVKQVALYMPDMAARYRLGQQAEALVPENPDVVDAVVFNAVSRAKQNVPVGTIVNKIKSNTALTYEEQERALETLNLELGSRDEFVPQLNEYRDSERSGSMTEDEASVLSETEETIANAYADKLKTILATGSADLNTIQNDLFSKLTADSLVINKNEVYERVLSLSFVDQEEELDPYVDVDETVRPDRDTRAFMSGDPIMSGPVGREALRGRRTNRVFDEFSEYTPSSERERGLYTRSSNRRRTGTSPMTVGSNRLTEETFRGMQ